MSARLRSFLPAFFAALLVCLIHLASAPAHAQGAIASAVDEKELAALTQDQRERYKDLIQELRCLVCQNQTIADSNAELANDLRRQVLEQIAAGASDEQIRNYATERYGEFVLYKPRFNAVTALLWLGPALLVLSGLLIVWRVLRRRDSAGDVVEEAADPSALQRVLDKSK